MRVYTLLSAAMVLLLLLGGGVLPAEESAPGANGFDPEDEDPVRLEVSTTELEVGSRFSLTFQLPVGARYDRLEFELPRGQSHLWRFGEVERTGTNTFAVEGRPLLRGEHSLGPLEVTLSTEDGESQAGVLTDRLSLEVAPPDGEFTGELRGTTGPLGLPFDYFWRNVILGTAAAIGLLLLAWLAWLVYKFVRKRAARILAPVPPNPLEEAFSAIRTLKSGEVLEEHGVERFYTQLSTLLRRYLEREFDYPVLEMSEDEATGLLRGQLRWLDHAKDLGAVLQRSSLAKFARQEVTDEEAMHDCGAVEQFLVSEEYRKKAEQAAERKRAAQKQESREDRAA